MKLPFKFRSAQAQPSGGEAMTLTQHLGELRSRIIRSVLAVSLGMMVILAFYDPVLRFLRQPYAN
nr:twin-arginine translocase subunit TatC [Actinomycetota bacterium]